MLVMFAKGKSDRSYTYDDYMNSPEDVRIEIIDGEIFNMAPPSRIHQMISGELFGEIHHYLKDQSCEVYAAPFGVFLGDDEQDIRERHCVEPDISVICDKNKLIDEGCLGSPNFIIEIVSPSTKGHDYVRKLNLYSRYGVKEYWIVNPLNETILVYIFENDNFGAPTSYTFEDTVPSDVLKAFSFDFSTLSLQ